MEKDVDNHKGCPNRGHCKRDESKCCYLLSNHTCYLDSKKASDWI